MTNNKKYSSPTFVEVGTKNRLDTNQSILSCYNALAVEQYSPTFLDISLEPDTRRRRRVAPSPPRGIWEVLQNRRWGWGLAKGTAMAALLGGLFLGSEHLVPTALAAPSPDPPLPPAVRTGDDGTVESLVERIGDDSPLWQFVEPGDGSALWQFVERVGPDSPLWDRLEQAGPDSPLWKRVERLGADNPVWDKMGQNGDDGQLNRLIERTGGDGPTWRLVGTERRSEPTFRTLDKRDQFAGPLAVTEADDPPNFIERCGYNNPFYAYSGSFGALYYYYYYDGGPAPAFVDIDGDGDFDAFVGELYGKSYCSYPNYSRHDVRFFENLHYDNYYGDYGSAYFVEQCGPYNPLPLRVGGTFTATFAAPTFVDIDGDGDFDAFVGEQYGYSPTCGLYSEHDVRFFRNYSVENYGDPYTPVFTETCGLANPLPLRAGGTFTATFPTPTFVDIDGDGDFDAFVGEHQGYSPSPACYPGYSPSYNDIRFFRNYSVENYGDPYTPVFTETCGLANPFYAYSGSFGVGGGPTPFGGASGPAPTFVDIDGDGDFDAFVGEGYGGYGPCGFSGFGIRFFENTGDANTPAFTEQCGDANPLFSGIYGYSYYGGLGLFLHPMPTFVEIDGDGDFDAFVGQQLGVGKCGYYGYSYGDIRFFENKFIPVGGVTEPARPLTLLQPWASLAAAAATGVVGAALHKLKRHKA